ncbi:MAG TPA: hypothetical protein VGH27_25450 [Streptosporangiaceae bacterium]|jgi:hypothetical protein
MTAGGSQLERSCRRLLTLYPAGHRRLHEEEMVGVMLASAGAGQRGLPLRDAADLIVGATRIWLHWASRRCNPRGADALALVSVLAPVLLCAEALANSGLVGGAWLALGGRLPASFTSQQLLMTMLAHGPRFWPLIAGGPVVLGLALRGLRLAAALAALAVAAAAAAAITQITGGWLLVVTDPSPIITASTSLLAAAALLLSAGPHHGLRLLQRPVAALTGAGLLALVVLTLGLCVEIPGRHGLYSFYDVVGAGYGDLHPSAGLALLAGGIGFAILGLVACWCLRSTVRRRVLLLLAVPTVPYLVTGLWRLTIVSADWFGILGRFLPLLSVGWLALLLAGALLAVLVPLPTGRVFHHAGWRAEQSR